jgi:hypothetical protein
MNTDELRLKIRAQVRSAVSRQATAAGQPTSGNPAASHKALVVPLRLGNAQDTSALTQLFKRLAASPALLQAVNDGLLRFDLRLDAGAVQAVTAQASPANAAHAKSSNAMAATTTIDPAACCSSCKTGKTCECGDTVCDAHAQQAKVPELKGVIGEKLVRSLASGVKTVRLNPKAVLTPLGKDALRKRGITVDRGETT